MPDHTTVSDQSDTLSGEMTLLLTAEKLGIIPWYYTPYEYNQLSEHKLTISDQSDLNFAFEMVQKV